MKTHILALALSLSLVETPLRAGETAAELTVVETAGIRRFSYPVTASFRLARPLLANEKLRLLDSGLPVVAQFKTVTGQEVELDFSASHAPCETRTYRVERGLDFDPPVAAKGLRVQENAGVIQVDYPGGLEFVVPKDLRGLFHQVQTPRSVFVKQASRDLVLEDRGGERRPLIAHRAAVIKNGPLAVRVKFEGTTRSREGQKVPSVVEMDFPLSKSWVKVTWSVDDPIDQVAALGGGVNLNLTAEPILVDFGATTLVYAALRKGQTAQFQADSRRRPPWIVSTGSEDKLQPYVQGIGQANGVLPEGWVHVMDRERGTAAAVVDFGRLAAGTMRVDADGGFWIRREFPAGSGGKSLTFYLHFVSMPVHLGAATSPQAMLAPLQVDVKTLP